MHADLATALSDHARATERWLALVEGASPEQCGWRPAPERWSLAAQAPGNHARVRADARFPA